MNNEIWKDIDEFKGMYQVSNYGRIKSLERIVERNNKGKTKVNEKILKTYINKKTGYCYAMFSILGKNKIRHIHRLVAKAFIPNPQNKKDINHKDCNRTNNYIDNLEWCTRSENIKYGFKYGKIKCNFTKRYEKVKGDKENDN